MLSTLYVLNKTTITHLLLVYAYLFITYEYHNELLFSYVNGHAITI